MAGELPVVLTLDGGGVGPVANLFKKQGGSTAGSGGCMFGAECAILVRDEKHKAEVLAAVGSGALVLTVHEAKGLEFQVRRA